MKKYLIIPLLLLVFLTACGGNGEPSENGSGDNSADRKEVFSKFVKIEDVSSYVLTSHGQIRFTTKSNGESETNTYDSVAEFIKEPRTYHFVWDDNSEGTKEEYVTEDNVIYQRTGDGDWSRREMDASEAEFMEKPVFSSSKDVNGNSLIELLGDYFELRETEDLYIAELSSTPENIQEIEDIIWGQSDEYSMYRGLNSLNAKLTYQKDSYYPESFELEFNFTDEETGNELSIKQKGNYEKINELEKIEIPEEVENI